jgi:hypothetical protein
MRLHELTQDELQLLNMLEEGQDISDTLEAVRELSTDKLEGYAKIIKQLEGNVAIIQLEEKRLQAKRKINENGVKRMKEAIYNHMKTTGKEKVDGQLFKFTIAKNPQSVKVLDETMIPKKYFVKQAPTLDVKGISELLKSGVKVRGVQLTQGESLRIK